MRSSERTGWKPRFLKSRLLPGRVSSAQNQPFHSLESPQTRRFSRLERRDGTDPQTSISLSSSCTADLSSNGLENPTSASLTSLNNFINYCASTSLPLSTGDPNARQAACSPIPIGLLPSPENIPSAKFSFPTNGVVIPEGTLFNVTLKLRNFAIGDIATATYISVPQQLNAEGKIIGHAHVVIELLQSLNQTNATNPNQFALWRTLSAQTGQSDTVSFVTGGVAGGLPEGFYRLSATLSSTSRQPIVVSVSQHGAINDAVYFTVSSNTSVVSSAAASVAKNTTEQTDTSVLPDPLGLQTSSTLDSALIVNNSAPASTDGEIRTSKNNFINFCAQFPSVPLWSGIDGTSSSYNPGQSFVILSRLALNITSSPFGLIVGLNVAPSVKFALPKMGTFYKLDQLLTCD
ncbi:hypothetical protein C8J56DRAFT_205185 [Mycena floridula]|nr:hypothetical protein C8J56DRAFT_205185 [Mycena floridula]